MMNSLKKIVLLLCVVSLMACMCTPGDAAVIRVPDDQATIPAAISSATNGDEIQVWSGHLESNASRFNIDKALSIISYATGYTAKEIGATIESTGSGQGALQLVSDATDVLLEGLIIRPDHRGILVSSTIPAVILTLVDCTLADGSEAGIRAEGVNNMTLSMTRCTLTGFGYRGIHMHSGSNLRTHAVTIADSTFINTENPAMYLSTSGGANYTISNSRFEGCTAGGSDPTIRINAERGTHTVTISDCVFGAVTPNYRNLQICSTNTGSDLLNLTANVDSCMFYDTESAQSIMLSGERNTDPSSSADITFTNCFVESDANGGAIASLTWAGQDGDILFQHCTIATKDNNYAVANYMDAGTLSLANCIVQGGSTALRDSIDVGDDGVIISNANILNATVTSEGSVTLSGNEIINVDPLFVDELNDDYHLLGTSPALNAGVDLNVDFDLDGVARDDTPDVGCYEGTLGIEHWSYY